MQTPLIGLLVGSTRRGRFADKPSAWIQELVATRPDLRLEVLDLRDFPLPFFDEAAPPAAAKPSNEVAGRWATELARFDGFIFLTPEYNHCIPGVLKNALDYAYHEWALKPAAFVGYGSLGAARAIHSLRPILSSLRMAPLAKAVHIGSTDFAGLRSGRQFSDYPTLESAGSAMLDELTLWAKALRTVRIQD